MECQAAAQISIRPRARTCVAEGRVRVPGGRREMDSVSVLHVWAHAVWKRGMHASIWARRRIVDRETYRRERMDMMGIWSPRRLHTRGAWSCRNQNQSCVFASVMFYKNFCLRGEKYLLEFFNELIRLKK
jgi:hypothetical protein